MEEYLTTAVLHKNQSSCRLNNLEKILFIHLFMGSLALPQLSLSEEKIEVIPIIQSSKGLSGKNFNYLEGKPELRL